MTRRLTNIGLSFRSMVVSRLLGLLIAALGVLVGLASAFQAGASVEPVGAAQWREPSRLDVPASMATAQQATTVQDSEHRADCPCPATEDDDDDCNEATAVPSRFSFHLSFPAATVDPLLPNDIRPSQGHRAGPEKPPRA
jgi:hypothetical protein